MQTYQVLALCILILYASGVLGALCRGVGVAAFPVAFAVLCAAALGEFTFGARPELSFRAGIAAMPLLFLIYAPEREYEAGGGPFALLFCCAVTLLLQRVELLQGNAALGGIIAGCTAALLPHKPVIALAAATGAPAICVLLQSGLDMLLDGYTSCDLSSGSLLFAQMLALCFALVLLRICRMEPGGQASGTTE